MAPDARGQNIASTALAALVEWGRRCLDLLEVRLVILPGNAASERVAARAGFVRSEAGDAPRGLAFIRLLLRH